MAFEEILSKIQYVFAISINRVRKSEMMLLFALAV